jgi:replication-associated recombination protein RarA
MQKDIINPGESFISKHRPTNLAQLVLPWQHGLNSALDFVANPHPEAYLFYGPPGLGKTSLARIIAHAAAGDPFSVRYFMGPDLDSNTVRDIAAASFHPPLFGKLHAFVVDEADSIPRGGQIRLLGMLENPGPTVWVFTSNEGLDDFEPRFVSRVKALHFSTQGMFDPATKWLLTIAKEEGVALSKATAQRLIRECKNNLRAALQALELMKADQVKGRLPRAGAVPQTTRELSLSRA